MSAPIYVHPRSLFRFIPLRDPLPACPAHSQQDIENFKAEFEKRSQQLQGAKAISTGTATVTPLEEPAAPATATATATAASPLSSPEGSR